MQRAIIIGLIIALILSFGLIGCAKHFSQEDMTTVYLRGYEDGKMEGYQVGYYAGYNNGVKDGWDKLYTNIYGEGEEAKLRELFRSVR